MNGPLILEKASLVLVLIVIFTNIVNITTVKNFLMTEETNSENSIKSKTGGIKSKTGGIKS